MADASGPRAAASSGAIARARREPHIFISFKTEERAAAVLLKDALEAGGFSVWWQENIQCGREWHGDIDAALLSAGCIVVLWSPAAIGSPWVRHEASQAVARGVYTPVRLAPMDIGSPFDRIQATDLFNWKGEPHHPGLVRLLARANELIPQPPEPYERVTRFLARNKAGIAASAIGVAAIGMLIRLSFGLEAQLSAQSDIAQSIQRTLHPLPDIRVSAYVDIDPAIPGVQDYLARLRQAIAVSAEGHLSEGKILPRGVHASRTSASGAIEALSISPASGLWPVDTATSWLGALTRFMELNIAFSLQRDRATDPQTADLSFAVGSYDPDGSEGQRLDGHSIEWDVAAGKLSLNFSDVASKPSWHATGEIASVPDLDKAVLFIEIGSTVYASLQDTNAIEGTKASRRKLALSRVFLDYAGRRVMIRSADLRTTTGRMGMPAYVGDFATVAKRL
jgi:hypothetical protein